MLVPCWKISVLQKTERVAVLNYRFEEAPRTKSSCFLLLFKEEGEGQTHIKKIMLQAFWQYKIDIKRLLKGKIVTHLGLNGHNFKKGNFPHKFMHYFVAFCRNRPYALFQ